MNGRVMRDRVRRGIGYKILVGVLAWFVVLGGVFTGIGFDAGSSVEAASVKKGTVTVSVLNMRSGVGVSKKKIGYLRKGNVVDIRGTYKSGRDVWYKVTYRGKTGYVSGKYVKVTSSTVLKKSSTLSKKVLYKASVNTKTLTVRYSTSTKSKSYGSIKKGQVYNVYESRKVGSITWYRILYKGKWAYVSSSYMKKVTTPKKPVSKPVTKPVTNNTGVKDSGSEEVKVGDSLDRILTGTITTNGLNIRKWPGTNSSVLGSLDNGDIIQIVGKNVVDGETWYKFEYMGAYAFVHSGFVKVVAYGETPVSVDKPVVGSLAGKVIVLDAGHGGSDPGAVSNGMYEKELVFDVTKRVERLLKAKGATVLLTRNSDVYPTLEGRVAFANSRNADIFVSVHANAATASARGIETFYSVNNLGSGTKSRSLALDIQSEMIKSTGAVNRGVKSADYLVIRYTKMPAVLLELGFITNSTEASKLKTSAYRETLAQSIDRGIVNYYK